MKEKKRSLPNDSNDSASSSNSGRALEKEGEKALVDKPEEKRKIKGEDFLRCHLLAGPQLCVQDGDTQVSLQAEPLRLYGELGPRDGAEAILAALAVAATNASMHCLNGAARCDDDSRARELNLRYGLKGASTVRDLIGALDNHRSGSPKGVSVGEVNVGSGGQAIVGNVERPVTSESGRKRPKSKR